MLESALVTAFIAAAGWGGWVARRRIAELKAPVERLDAQQRVIESLANQVSSLLVRIDGADIDRVRLDNEIAEERRLRRISDAKADGLQRQVERLEKENESLRDELQTQKELTQVLQQALREHGIACPTHRQGA